MSLESTKKIILTMPIEDLEDYQKHLQFLASMENRALLHLTDERLKPVHRQLYNISLELMDFVEEVLKFKKNPETF